MSNNHHHFSTLQLSEVKKDSSFLDDPRSPPQLFSAGTVEQNLLSRSKSHQKRISADWTSSKKDKPVPKPAADYSSQKKPSQQQTLLKPHAKILGNDLKPLTIAAPPSSKEHFSMFYEETPSSVKKVQSSLLREREQRIREFTEMNERLNQMKECFKREMIRSSSELQMPSRERQE